MAQQAWLTSTSVPLAYLIQGSYTGEKLEQRSGKSLLIKKDAFPLNQSNLNQQARNLHLNNCF